MTNTERWQEFGRAITIARNARGWSQRRLAGEAGVSPTTLGALERGEADPVRSRAMPSVAAALRWPLHTADLFMAGRLDAADLEAFATSTDSHSDSAEAIQRDRNEVDQLAGEIAELDDEDREVVRDLVRRLRNR